MTTVKQHHKDFLWLNKKKKNQKHIGIYRHSSVAVISVDNELDTIKHILFSISKDLYL